MIKIYSTVFSNTEFIKLQYKYLTKYCTDEFKLIVINNGKTPELESSINNTCLLLNVEQLHIEKNHSFPSMSHSFAMNQVLNNHIKVQKDWEIAVIMDSDIFPFKPFSFKEILGNHQIGGIYQQRKNLEIEYLSTIFLLFNNRLDITDLDVSLANHADTGGKTDEFLKNKNIIPNWIDHTAAIDIESDYIFRNNNNKFPYIREYRSQFIAGCLFHYYRGGNWDNMTNKYHENKIQFLNYFLENLELYNLNLDTAVHYNKAHAEKGWNGVDHSYNDYRFINKNVNT